MDERSKFFGMTKKLFKGNIRYFLGFIILISITSILSTFIDPVILNILFDAFETGDSKKVFLTCIQAGILTIIIFVLCYIQNCYCDIWLYRLIGNGNGVSFIQYHALPYEEKKLLYEEGDVFNRINMGVDSIAYIWLFSALIVCNSLSFALLTVYAIRTSSWIVWLAIVLFLFSIIRIKYESGKNIVFTKQGQELEGIREKIIYTLIHKMEFLVMTDTVDILKGQYINVRNKIWEVEKRRIYLSICIDALELAIKGALRGVLSFKLFPLKGSGIISVGQVAASFSTYDSLYSCLSYLRRPVVNLPQKFVPFQRFSQMLGLQRNNQNQSTEVDKEPLINIQEVCYNLGDREILKNVSIKIYKGQKVAIIGHNGCGKSTLLRIILGLYTPKSGYTTIMGYNSAHLAHDIKRSLISFIPSQSQLFNQSSRWNIETGIDNEGTTNVEAIAQTLMIDQKSDSFLYKNANELSGGQAQRVNIARALINKAPIILADEPTSSLDNQMGENIIQEIINNAETAIIVTHHPSQIKYFDRIILMHNGLIIADENTDERSFANKEYYKGWLGLTAER